MNRITSMKKVYRHVPIQRYPTIKVGTVRRDKVLSEKINKFLEKEYRYCKSKRYKDCFEIEIYVDYRDTELTGSTLYKIFNSAFPREEYSDIIASMIMDEEDYYYPELYKEITSEIPALENYTDFLREYIQEHISWYMPDCYLNQDLCVNITVDTGDGNFDFTRNELFGCNYTKGGVHSYSSLVWLMHQQGYNTKQIRNFVNNEDVQDSKLLRSIYQECINTTSCMNTLVFCVKMTLAELFDLNDILNDCQKKNPKNYDTTQMQYDKNIIISKDATCGLYDAWNGGGSVLEIELEKDVVLPIKFICKALPDIDKLNGYSIHNIYGVYDSLWDGEVKFERLGA